MTRNMKEIRIGVWVCGSTYSERDDKKGGIKGE